MVNYGHDFQNLTQCSHKGFSLSFFLREVAATSDGDDVIHPLKIA